MQTAQKTHDFATVKQTHIYTRICKKKEKRKKQAHSFLTLAQMWRHSGALAMLKQTRPCLCESYLLKLLFSALPCTLLLTLLDFYMKTRACFWNNETFLRFGFTNALLCTLHTCTHMFSSSFMGVIRTVSPAPLALASTPTVLLLSNKCTYFDMQRESSPRRRRFSVEHACVYVCERVRARYLRLPPGVCPHLTRTCHM